MMAKLIMWVLLDGRFGHQWSGSISPIPLEEILTHHVPRDVQLVSVAVYASFHQANRLIGNDSSN